MAGNKFVFREPGNGTNLSLDALATRFNNASANLTEGQKIWLGDLQQLVTKDKDFKLGKTLGFTKKSKTENEAILAEEISKDPKFLSLLHKAENLNSLKQVTWDLSEANIGAYTN